jgi:hypothetical protein
VQWTANKNEAVYDIMVLYINLTQVTLEADARGRDVMFYYLHPQQKDTTMEFA